MSRQFASNAMAWRASHSRSAACCVLLLWRPSTLYLWLKAFHVIAVIAWMAGMLYLPRLFVYHCEAEPGSKQSETFKVMERRLLRAIINPGDDRDLGARAVARLGCGASPQRLAARQVRAGGRDVRRCTACSCAACGILPTTGTGTRQKFYRIINEVPTVLMIVIVILVVVKPFWQLARTGPTSKKSLRDTNAVLMIYQHLKLFSRRTPPARWRDVRCGPCVTHIFSYACAIPPNAGGCSGLPAPCIRTVASIGQMPSRPSPPPQTCEFPPPSRRSIERSFPRRRSSLQGLPRMREMKLQDLKSKTPAELLAFAEEQQIENACTMRKQELMFAILKQLAAQGSRHHRRRRRRSAVRRLRLPALAGSELPARPRRHLRLALADPPLRPAHRRHRRRPDPLAEGRRALLRAAQGQHDQFRRPREGAPQDQLRQPDAALSRRAAEDGARRSDQEGSLRPRHRHRRADRQGPARADRLAAAHRQDRAAAEHRALDHRQSSRVLPDRAADRRAAGRSHRHAALGEGRGRVLDLRRAGLAPRRRSPKW